MPIDPRVALGVQPIQINDPMQSLAQVAGLQNIRAEQEYKRERLDYQRQQQEALRLKTAEEAKEQAETEQFQKRFGGLPRLDREQVLSSLPSDVRMRSEARLAAFDKLMAEADEAESKAGESRTRIQSAQLKALGQLAQGVAEYGDDPQFGYNMDAAAFAFSQARDRFGDEVERHWQWVQEDPQRRLKPFIDQMIAQGTEEQEGVVVQPGQEIRSKISGRLIGKGPTKAETAPTLGSFEDYVLRYAQSKGIDPKTLTPADIQQARKEYGQADDRAVRVEVNASGLTPRTASAVRELGGRFMREDVVRWAKTVAAAASFARTLDMNTTNPADQQAMIYSFAKMMDPESVVREGEYETVRKYAQSWSERFGFDVMRVVDSKAPLMTPDAMKRMKETMNRKYQSYLPQYYNARDEFARLINLETGNADGIDRLPDYGKAFPKDALGEDAGGAPEGGGGGPVGKIVNAPDGTRRKILEVLPNGKYRLGPPEK